MNAVFFQFVLRINTSLLYVLVSCYLFFAHLRFIVLFLYIFFQHTNKVDVDTIGICSLHGEPRNQKIVSGLEEADRAISVAIFALGIFASIWHIA